MSVSMYFSRVYLVILCTISLVSCTSHTYEENSTMSLKPCPKSPNCVCSEHPDDSKHYIEPIPLSVTTTEAVKNIISAIESTGGKVKSQSENYIHATYTSKIMRFVDDVEFRIDEDNAKIHIRSASRLGYSDFGVNKKRVNAIKAAL